MNANLRIIQIDVVQTQHIFSLVSVPPPLSSETSWTTETSSSYKCPSSKVNTNKHFIATTNALISKSRGNESSIAGASIAGIIAVTIVILVVCLLKRRRFNCLQAEHRQENRHHVTNNTTYNDLVVTNQRQVNNDTTLSYNKQAKL